MSGLILPNSLIPDIPTQIAVTIHKILIWVMMAQYRLFKKALLARSLEYNLLSAKKRRAQRGKDRFQLFITHVGGWPRLNNRRQTIMVYH